eukprot:3102914-Pyramimonas_sp.AAC.1
MRAGRAGRADEAEMQEEGSKFLKAPETGSRLRRGAPEAVEGRGARPFDISRRRGGGEGGKRMGGEEEKEEEE